MFCPSLHAEKTAKWPPQQTLNRSNAPGQLIFLWNNQLLLHEQNPDLSRACTQPWALPQGILPESEAPAAQQPPASQLSDLQYYRAARGQGHHKSPKTVKKEKSHIFSLLVKLLSCLSPLRWLSGHAQRCFQAGTLHFPWEFCQRRSIPGTRMKTSD
ncbi:uncharacterized protein O3Q21_005314 [Podargus strigoides]